jgi:hypothetical protein
VAYALQVLDEMRKGLRCLILHRFAALQSLAYHAAMYCIGLVCTYHRPIYGAVSSGASTPHGRTPPYVNQSHI